MDPLLYLSFRKVVVICILLFFFLSSVLIPSVSSSTQYQSKQFLGRRRLLKIQEAEEGDGFQHIQLKKKSTSGGGGSDSLSSSKTQSNSKAIKSNLSTKNQTKLNKTSGSTSKNQAKLLIKSTDSSKTSLTTTKSDVKKLNSTSKALKSTNSTSKALKSTNSPSTKKSSDLIKQSSSKNKTTTATKPTSTKQTKSTKIAEEEITGSNKKPKTTQSKKETITQKPKQEKTLKKKPSWLDQDDDDTDLVSEFRDLPIKFQQTLIPDLERISTTSKAYINKYNKEFTKNFKPYVGNKYAPTIASIISFAFILIPLLLVSLVVNQIKAYFSLQKILIFIQVYLSIYFSILCLSALVTGLEPLKFFYATSLSTYVGLQVLQTLAYVMYLLLLLMYLILVFSTESGLGSKMLGLAQTFVGFAVGLHYYVAVFHRVVLHQPPKTNWKVHGIYATCFLVICLFANAERRKKAYLEEGGEEGKKN